MSQYGETVYGTRAGPIPPRTWGISTQKNGKVFVHILSWQERHLVLPDVPGIKRIRDFEGSAVQFERIGDELLLTLPADQKAPIDRILVLER